MSQGPLKVLLVDDDENTALLFRLIIEREGLDMRLQTAVDGQRAISYLAGEGPYADRTTYPMPDLLVLDLLMPGVGGLDVLDWRRNRPGRNAIPVVVFSGSLRQDDQAAALAKGANRFVAKPGNLQEFKSALADILSFGLTCRPPTQPTDQEIKT